MPISQKERDGILQMHTRRRDPHPQYGNEVSVAAAQAAADAAQVSADAAQVDIDDHIADTAAAHAATAIANTPAGTITATTVQAALDELDNDARMSDARTPTGAAGGVLSGTYPNPGFAVDMATQAELDAVAAAKQNLDATLTALAGLSTAANKVPMFTGSDTASTIGVSRVYGGSGTAVSHTGDTLETTKVTQAIASGAVATNGLLRVRIATSHTGSTNAKTLRVKLGGTTFLTRTTTTASHLGGWYECNIMARGRTSQIAMPQSGTADGGAATVAAPTGTVDLDTALDLTITVQLADGGETIAIEWWQVELLNP